MHVSTAGTSVLPWGRHVPQARNRKGDEEVQETKQQLEFFDFGKHLLERKGVLDGEWFDYVVRRSWNGRRMREVDGSINRGVNNKGEVCSECEWFILDRAPRFLALQDYFTALQSELNGEVAKRIEKDLCMASFPCGPMEDLLGLCFVDCKKSIKLMGVDWDEGSKDLVEQRVEEKKRPEELSEEVMKKLTWDFVKVRGWELKVERSYKNLKGKCDVFVVNGFFYEGDLKDIFKNVLRNLKPGGAFACGFFTQPSKQDLEESSRRNVDWDKRLEEETFLFDKVVGAKFRFHREVDVKSALEGVGFENIVISYARFRMCLLVMADRPLQRKVEVGEKERRSAEEGANKEEE